MNIYDEGAPDWRTLHNKRHVARKPHNCDNSPGLDSEGNHTCGIEPGRIYRLLVGLEDGVFTIARYCISCPRVSVGSWRTGW